MTVRLTGTDRLARAIAALGDRAPKAAAAFLYQEGEAIMAAAKPITPIEFGALRSTGHVEPPRREGSRIEVVIGFGGASAPYALIVHERMDLRHRAPTQAKYLEEPFRRRMVGFEGRFAAALERKHPDAS